MRNVAYRVVSRLLALAQKETRNDSIQGKARFREEFGAQDDEAEADGKARHHVPEHSALFHGNTDDHFRLGIKLTRQATESTQEGAMTGTLRKRASNPPTSEAAQVHWYASLPDIAYACKFAADD